MSEKEYTSVSHLHYLIAMLKAYKIKNIVASSGTQNSNFNIMVQNDNDFECYSVVDERSAAYFALGLSYETNSPSVITCTGATSSRNYLSAMTEAYYKKIPVIALTFFNPVQNSFNLSPQFTDRKQIQKDVAYCSITLPIIRHELEKQQELVQLNAALFMAVNQNLPVHINCSASLNFNEEYILPQDIWTAEFYDYNFESVKKELKNKKFAIFSGLNTKLKPELEKAIEDFALSYDIPVFCDYSSNYYGKNKVLISFVTQRIKNVEFPELIIDIGGVTGDYSAGNIFKNAEVWRISPDKILRSRYNKPVSKLFCCDELYFFKLLKNTTKSDLSYFSSLKKSLNQLNDLKLPLSNAFVCQNLAKHIPKNSSLHLGILNSFRCMNFYGLDNSVNVNCNTGAFGIDGAISTIIGQSMGDKNKKYFAVVGDLAFFYDMNALGLRQVTNNLRIIVINNNRGEEFRLSPKLEEKYGNQLDTLVAAGGHYNRQEALKYWALGCGFEYLKASTKEEFENLIDVFCCGNFDKPVLFEVVTKNEDEKLSIDIIKKQAV